MQRFLILATAICAAGLGGAAEAAADCRDGRCRPPPAAAPCCDCVVCDCVVCDCCQPAAPIAIATVTRSSESRDQCGRRVGPVRRLVGRLRGR